MSNICHSLDHVVDELHLMLHVTDILIENLVSECLDWDHEVVLDKKGGSKGNTFRKPNSGDQILQRFFWCVGTKKCRWKSQWQIWLEEPLRIWQEDPIGWPTQQSAQYPPPRKCINCHWDMDSICWHSWQLHNGLDSKESNYACAWCKYTRLIVGTLVTTTMFTTLHPW